MNALLTYAVGSAAVLAVLWVGFRLLLRSQKTFRVNRVLLNLILYFALCAPLLLSRLSIPVPDGRAPGVVGLMTLSGQTVFSDGGSSPAMEEASGARLVSWLPEALTTVYVAGVALTLLTQVILPVAAAVGAVGGLPAFQGPPLQDSGRRKGGDRGLCSGPEGTQGGADELVRRHLPSCGGGFHQ